MSATTAMVRAPFVLPGDPYQRFLVMEAKVGTFVRIQSGDFEIAGRLVSVLRPAMGAEADNPIVTVDVDGERIAGPVLAGDRLV